MPPSHATPDPIAMPNPTRPTPRLYPHNASAGLDAALFRDPPSEYRGVPFWCWNNKLDRGQLLRQIGYLQEMGFGGFNIHPRTGLATTYLGDEFMDLVRACTDEAERRAMLCWLYDEDRWPSGYAGGFVTSEPAFRQRHLLWTPRPYDPNDPPQAVNNSGAFAARTGNGTLIGRYAIRLEGGFLADYRRLAHGETPPDHCSVWYAYAETALPVAWFNHQTYVDTLNPTAVRRFIDVTHEHYQRVVGDAFGGVIPAIFTDEPQFVRKGSLDAADSPRDVMAPWTGDFPDSYAAAYGERIEDALPELFWERPGRAPSRARYRYHDHVAERFASAFADQIGAWCEGHGIALTGHMMEEPTLESQTHSTGEAMRSLRAFQLPGIDMLCDRMELTTAKQAQSIAHQYGREGVLSELYGVTNWDFDFVGHKAQGDWQAALGVTIRVPHLAWVSMAGEAKRDYPASIFYQSPWFREYPLIEDHFARVNTAMTRGKPLVRVAVVHPIESFWLAYGPREQTQAERSEREAVFQDLCRWLLFGQIDFDYLCESLLPDLCPAGAGAPLEVGAMAYDTVVVPSLRTIRSTTLDRLERFVDAGGHLVFAGETPTLVDAAPSDRPQLLAARAERVPFSRTRILAAVAPWRELEVRGADASQAESILHQIREDGNRRYVFLCNTDRIHGIDGARIRLNGLWRPTQLDTFTGERVAIASEERDGLTIVPWDAAPHGHLLLELEPGLPTGQVVPTPQAPWPAGTRLEGPVPVTLSEPNVLLLDQAEWRVDDGPWQPREEVLRIENHARAHWGLPPKEGNIAQPWSESGPVVTHGTIGLRFRIETTVAVAGAALAMENPSGATVWLDGRPVSMEVTGWWVDEAIQTLALPPLEAGVHELVLQLPFTRQTDLEWCYLLGDFGVHVAGSRAYLTQPVRELMFGDWTRQGLPFYAGNVTYHAAIDPGSGGGGVAIAVPNFKAPLIGVALDGRRAGSIAFAPFEIELGRLDPGEHRLDLTAFGNRYNAFGPLHNNNPLTVWFGPSAWRTEGRHFAYEYLLKPMGILTAPLVKRRAE